MKLVVGLGNPGREYAGTFHNVGFDALDRLAARFDVPAFTSKDNALVTDALIGGQRVMLAKPQTYMNLSGDAVGALARYYKLLPEDILVFYDDLDIPVGSVRARPDGSAGTHNGMRDIVAKLGSTGFARIRIGTGPKPNYMALADYVLSHYGDAHKKVFEPVIETACDMAEMWISGKPWQDMTVSVV